MLSEAEQLVEEGFGRRFMASWLRTLISTLFFHVTFADTHFETKMH